MGCCILKDNYPVCVCEHAKMCIGVCVRERDRERDRRERERERETQREREGIRVCIRQTTGATVS